jgi:hypothetical protein
MRGSGHPERNANDHLPVRFKRAGVRIKGILECTILPKNAHRTILVKVAVEVSHCVVSTKNLPNAHSRFSSGSPGPANSVNAVFITPAMLEQLAPASLTTELPSVFTV